VDSSLHRPILSGENKPIPTESLNITATNNKNNSLVLAKVYQSNKQIRKFPYNTRPPKKPLLSPQDKPLPSNSSPSPSRTPQVSRKRLSINDLASPPQKGPGVSIESDEPPNTAPTTTPMFTPSYFEKSPTRAIYKAARKGKNKLVSIVIASKFEFEMKGGFVKPPQQQ
jgi:hypothetical protein